MWWMNGVTRSGINLPLAMDWSSCQELLDLQLNRLVFLILFVLLVLIYKV